MDLSILPNPFELFEKNKKKENMENTKTDGLNDDDIETSENSKKKQTKRETNPKIKNIKQHQPQENPVETPKIKENMENNTKETDKNISFYLFILFFMIFVILSIIYFVYDKFYIFNELKKDFNTTNFWEKFRSKIIVGKFLIFFVLWLFVCFFNLMFFTTIFENRKTYDIFYITTICFFGIVGNTFLIIGNIPSLVEIFENTIGYWFLNIPYVFNLNETMRIFKSKNFENINIFIPFNILLTTFSILNVNDVFNQIDKKISNKTEYYKILYNDNKIINSKNVKADTNMNYDFFMDYTELLSNDKEKNKNYKFVNNMVHDNLLGLVLAKNNIGHMVWVYISTVISIMVSMNSV